MPMTNEVSKVDTGRILTQEGGSRRAPKEPKRRRTRMCDKKLSNNLAQRLAKEG